MKKHKNKITAGVILAIVLGVVFWYGGDAPGLRGWTVQPKVGVNVVTDNTPVKTEMPTAADIPTEYPASAKPTKEDVKEAGQKVSEIPIKQADKAAAEENKPKNTDNTSMTPAEKEALAERIAEESNAARAENGSKAYSEADGAVINESTVKNKYIAGFVSEGKPLPLEPQDAVISDKEYTCTLSVSCDTIIKNIARLDKEKVNIVPKDGVIFAEKTVTFYEGESVFNLLRREMKRNKIHIEFENIPIYNSAYIEGIANIYEFDCGELSGWMYKVNDWFPNYGSSCYRLKDGDRVEWVYTCDLGIDVGEYHAAKGE